MRDEKKIQVTRDDTVGIVQDPLCGFEGLLCVLRIRECGLATVVVRYETTADAMFGGQKGA